MDGAGRDFYFVTPPAILQEPATQQEAVGAQPEGAEAPEAAVAAKEAAEAAAAEGAAGAAA